MKYYLFLDDVRMPRNATIDLKPLADVSGIGNTNWEIVRNIHAFKQIVEGKGVPEVVTFDHDLCDEHIKHFVANNADGFDYFRFNDTGYHAAKWLCEYCHEKGLPFPTWHVHSFNPVGRENIKKLISRFPHAK